VPVGVVLTLGELHAHLIGHYSFTGTSRFGWVIAYVLLIEAATYLIGVPDVHGSTGGMLWSSLGAASSGAVAISLAQLASGSLLLPRAVVIGTGLTLFPIFALLTMSARRAARRGAGEDRVLAVLGPDESAALGADFKNGLERPAQLGCVLTAAEASGPGRGLTGLLVEEAERCRPTVVVLGREAQASESVVAQAATLHGMGIRVRSLAHFYEEWLGKLPLGELERTSLFFDIQELHAPLYARAKRLLDLLCGVAGLVALVPVGMAVAALDLFGNRGPLLFRQVRVGKGGRCFTILKFRTMPPGLSDGEWTCPDDPRLGRVGQWLRRLHVDEIPQVVNLLRGELSVVGPRPEQPRYVEELNEKIPFYEVRHLVKPGLTGWAQVKFPYGSSVDDALEKLQYEFFYLRHQGPALDTRIMARTLRSMVRLEGR
jgi:lipopolysaccharide/colanic/teichoic acid biosynthesis glycosyltransferase